MSRHPGFISNAVTHAEEELADARERASALAARAARCLAEAELVPARLRATFLAALRRCC